MTTTNRKGHHMAARLIPAGVDPLDIVTRGLAAVTEKHDRLETALETLLEELTRHPTVPASVQLAAGAAFNALRGVS